MSILKGLFFYICTIFKRILPDQTCILCGVSGSDTLCCAACTDALPAFNADHCPICALPALKGAICGHCLKNPPYFKRTVAAYVYAFPLDKLVLALKYGEKIQLVALLADGLAKCVSVRPDCLVAMPLHPARLRERGFNQSLLLVRRIGQQLDLPVLPFACQRVRNTASQSTLPWKARQKNMRKAFTCSQAVYGKHVAVIDDVMTTGATLNELARILLDAGATEVSAWVIARTLPHTGTR